MTLHNRDTTNVLLAPPTPCEPPFAAQHISNCCATPCTSDLPIRCTHHPSDAVTRSMQLCDPEKSHSGHSMLQQNAFGPAPTPAGTPSRAPIYGSTLPASLSGAHFCTRAYLLIPFGFSPLANTEVIDRATVCTSRDRGLSRRALRLNLVSSPSLRFVAAGAPTIKPSPHRSPPRYGQSHSTKTVP